MAKAFRLASASRRCVWSELRSEERADDDQPRRRGRQGAELGHATSSVSGGHSDRLPCQRSDRRTILRALGLNGADTDDRRCLAGVEISLWLWHRLAADPDRLARERKGIRRATQTRRRRGVSLAR